MITILIGWFTLGDSINIDVDIINDGEVGDIWIALTIFPFFIH